MIAEWLPINSNTVNQVLVGTGNMLGKFSPIAVWLFLRAGTHPSLRWDPNKNPQISVQGAEPSSLNSMNTPSPHFQGVKVWLGSMDQFALAGRCCNCTNVWAKSVLLFFGHLNVAVYSDKIFCTLFSLLGWVSVENWQEAKWEWEGDRIRKGPQLRSAE